MKKQQASTEPMPSLAEYAGAIIRYLALNNLVPDLPEGRNKSVVELDAFSAELDRQAEENRRINELEF